MVLRLIYMLPMLLGRTFDARTNMIGIDIFPKEVINSPKVIPETLFGSSYKTIESSSDVKEVLGIQGDLSLRIKGNAFDAKGIGSYLKETLNSENAVETLIKVSFRTYSQTLPSSSVPVSFWRSLNPEFIGTHFVQSIIYGGDLVASVSFKAVKSEYMQQIRGMVKASLEAGSALQLVAEGKLEMLEQKLKGMANVEVSYFATVPLEGVPNSIEGLSELVKNFQTHVKKVNNGWGVPVEVDLGELSTFDTKFQFLKNSLLESELTYFEESFDDLWTTKRRLKEWSSSLPIHLPQDITKKIEDLQKRISKTLRTFYQVISSLDMSGGPDQLKPSNLAYKENGKSQLPGKFKRELDKLIRRTVVESERSPSRGSSSYIHYGKTSCAPNSDTSLIYEGYLASSPDNVTGGGVNFVCLPKSPQQNFEIEYENLIDGAVIQGLKYGILEDGVLEDEQELILKGVTCALCTTEERTSVVMFPDSSLCPEEGNWITEYSGFLMSSSAENRGEHVCVDKAPDVLSEEATKLDQTLSLVKILTDNVEPENLRVVPCVVCSK